jgi:hypothetical protein
MAGSCHQTARNSAFYRRRPTPADQTRSPPCPRPTPAASPTCSPSPKQPTSCAPPVATLRYWRYLGTGPRSFRLGRRVLYRADDLRSWIDAQHDGQSAFGRGVRR